MPVLNPGVATRSRSPTLVVENRLDPGAWRFRLTVVDDTGLESAPAELVVRVVEQRLPPTGPTGPIVRPTDPRPTDPRPTDPRIVEPIRPITPSRPPG